MERFRTDGAVLKASATGEADRIVHILTRERGLVRAFAKGARSPKSRLHAGTVPFAFGEFDLTEKSSVFYVNAADPREIFYGLRLTLEKLTLAQYFCEVLLRTSTEGQSDPETLRLFLNALHLLCEDKKPMLQVKAVFELRLATDAGYAPALVGCDACGTYETAMMYFDPRGGTLRCGACDADAPYVPAPLAVVSAMRHIVFSEFDRVFSFSLEPSLLSALNRMTSAYLENCFQCRFRLLEMFNGLAEPGS